MYHGERVGHNLTEVMLEVNRERIRKQNIYRLCLREFPTPKWNIRSDYNKDKDRRYYMIKDYSGISIMGIDGITEAEYIVDICVPD